MTAEPLLLGARYDFHTTDGTVYENAVLASGDVGLGYTIRYGMLGIAVFIAPHEFARAEPCRD